MSSYSLELEAERIQDSRTRKYFDEVLSSYNSQNYRSAIVMLWSVVVCDLLFKLDQLKNAYNDLAARKILEELEKKQSANPKSPDWELELVTKVTKNTALLD